MRDWSFQSCECSSVWTFGSCLQHLLALNHSACRLIAHRISYTVHSLCIVLSDHWNLTSKHPPVPLPPLANPQPTVISTSCLNLSPLCPHLLVHHQRPPRIFWEGTRTQRDRSNPKCRRGRGYENTGGSGERKKII